MATFFPDDLMFFEILTRLPAKSLMRFKCVSKIWKTLISGNPYFIHAHRRQHNSEDNPLAIIRYNEYVDDGEDEEDEDMDDVEDVKPTPGPQRAKLLSELCSEASEVDMSDLVKEYGPVRFTSSCEGLICVMAEEIPERVVLWNPATQQRRQLPSLSDDNELHYVAIGLDDRSGDWKVVCLCLNQLNIDSQFSVRAHVLVKSNTAWRDCGASGIKALLTQVHPLAAAGGLHWVCSVEKRQNILSFDLDSEVLRLSKGPNCRYFTICKWRSSVAAITRDNYEYGRIESYYLTVSSPSSDSGGLSWSKLLKFTRNFKEFSRSIWREQFLLEYFGPYYTLALIDPKAPNEVRNLKQIRIDLNGGWDLRDYVLTIMSVF